jgi:hypothetical protein
MMATASTGSHCQYQSESKGMHTAKFHASIPLDGLQGVFCLAANLKAMAPIAVVN